jgi:hypothetical protein
MIRIIALLIMVIPGVIAAFGIKLMRDMLFGQTVEPFTSLPLQFFIGFILFASGLSFVAGFVLYRDRKRKKVQRRFQRPWK